MIKQVKDSLENIIALCKTHGVDSIALFGSAASGTMNEIAQKSCFN